jgi:hypothetical protein
MHYEFFHFELVPLIISTIAILYFDVIGAPLEWTKYVFWGCFFADVAIVLLFLSNTIKQITSYLGIECFTLKKVTPKIE